MGGPKAGIVLGEETLLARRLGQLRPHCRELIAVIGDCGQVTIPDIKVVSDSEAGRGPLMGLLTGLRAAAGDLCLVTACDMPFLDDGIVHLLVSFSNFRFR